MLRDRFSASLGSVAKPGRMVGKALWSARLKLELREGGFEFLKPSARPIPGVFPKPLILLFDVLGLDVRRPSLRGPGATLGLASLLLGTLLTVIRAEGLWSNLDESKDILVVEGLGSRLLKTFCRMLGLGSRFDFKLLIFCLVAEGLESRLAGRELVATLWSCLDTTGFVDGLGSRLFTFITGLLSL